MGVGVVIVTHGDLAAAMVRTAEGIVGAQRALAAVSLDLSDGSEEIRGKIHQAMQRVDAAQGVLVLTDMLGGTPSITSLQVVEKEGRRNVDVVAGLNLPMLLEVLLHRESTPRAALVRLAIRKGCQGIVHANVLVRVMTQSQEGGSPRTTRGRSLHGSKTDPFPARRKGAR